MNKYLCFLCLLWAVPVLAETSWLYKLSVLRFGKETFVQPQNGVINLNRLEPGEYYHVRGQALFFPGEFLPTVHLSVEQMQSLVALKKPLLVDQNMKIESLGIKGTSYNYGTFIMQGIHPPDMTLALALPRIYHAMEFYLATEKNSRLLFKAGKLDPDAAANESFGQGDAPILNLDVYGDFTIIAHVSAPMEKGQNLLSLSSFYIGESSYLRSVLYLSRYFAKAISGSFATIGLFYFCIFLFRPKDKSSIFLCLFSLFSFPVSLFYIFDLGLTPLRFLQVGTICYLLGVLFLLFFSMEKISFALPRRVQQNTQVLLIVLWAMTCIGLYFGSGPMLIVFFTADFIVGGIIVLATFYFVLKRRPAGVEFFLAGALLCLLFIFPMVHSFVLDANSEYGSNMLLANLSMALSFALMNAKEFAVTYHQLEGLLAEKTQLSEELELRNTEIKEMNSNLEIIVVDRTRSIEAILRNIRQGILTISDESLIIDVQYSQFLHEMTAQDTIAGRDLVEFLLDKSQLSADQLSITVNILRSIIEQDVLNFELNKSHMPREMEMSIEGHHRIFELDWDPICDGDRQVQKILVAMRDVTEFREQVQENKVLDAEFALLLSIVKAGRRAFLNFMLSSKMKIKQIVQLMEHGKAQAESLNLVMINLHTLKGNGRSLGFGVYSNLIHQAEQHILGFQGMNDLAASEVMKVMEPVIAGHQHLEFLAIHSLGWKTEEQNIEVKKDEYLIFLQGYQVQARIYPELYPLLEMLRQLTLRSFALLKSTLVDLTREAESIARRLQKLPPRIEIIAPECPLQDVGYRLLQAIIPHLLSNSIDHGLEDPETRHLKGKLDEGVIFMKFTRINGRACLEFFDDGQGLDLYKIAMKSGRSDLWPCREQSDRDKLAELIFMSGISTREEATEISGRGVGISAVRELLTQHGGSIHILTEDSQDLIHSHFCPIVFQLILPDDIFIEML